MRVLGAYEFYEEYVKQHGSEHLNADAAKRAARKKWAGMSSAEKKVYKDRRQARLEAAALATDDASGGQMPSDGLDGETDNPEPEEGLDPVQQDADQDTENNVTDSANIAEQRPGKRKAKESTRSAKRTYPISRNPGIFCGKELNEQELRIYHDALDSVRLHFVRIFKSTTLLSRRTVSRFMNLYEMQAFALEWEAERRDDPTCPGPSPKELDQFNVLTKKTLENLRKKISLPPPSAPTTI